MAARIVKYDGKDCSTRLNSKSQLRYGDVVSFTSLNPWAEKSFVSTLQNPLYAAARLRAYGRQNITRPFSLVATFEICPENDDTGNDGQPLTFGNRIRLKHCGTGQYLMVEYVQRLACGRAFRVLFVVQNHETQSLYFTRAVQSRQRRGKKWSMCASVITQCRRCVRFVILSLECLQRVRLIIFCYES